MSPHEAKVVILHPEPVATALDAFLKCDGHHAVVGVANTAAEAINKIRRIRRKPDVAIVGDTTLRKDVVQAIHKKFPDTKIIGISYGGEKDFEGTDININGDSDGSKNLLRIIKELPKIE